MWIRSSFVAVTVAFLGCSSASECLEKKTCTTGSIDAAKPEAGEGGAPIAPIATAGRGDAGSGGTPSSSQGESAPAPTGTSVGAPCDEDGARVCNTTGSGSILECVDGEWTRLESCVRGSRCDTRLVRCAPIVPGCERLSAGSSFCRAQTRVTCGPDLVTSEEEECAGRCAGGKCVAASCGDGVPQEGEVCDDGNTDDDDTCTSACQLPSCGDAIVSAGEECDDGNDDNRDGCTSDCVAAECGNAVVEGEEQCDDGNDDETDDCSSSCEELQLPPDIAQFKASTGSIVSGASATLSWDVIGADEVAIAPEVGVVSGTSITVSPAQTTTYTLTATNAHGRVTATATIALVSGGRIGWIRHYEHTGFYTQTRNAGAAMLNIGRQRLITANSTYSESGGWAMFIGEHSLQDGSLLKWSQQLTPHTPFAMCSLGTDLLLAGQQGQLGRTNGQYEQTAASSFEVVTGGGDWDYVRDIAATSKGSIFAVGYSGFANAGFIVSVPQDLMDPATYLTDSFLRALAIDTQDRLIVGGDSGFLAIYSAADLVAPTKTGSLHDSVYDLIIDHAGDVIATGNIGDGVDSGFVAKFGPELGNPLWRIELSGNPRRLAEDSAGNIFVLGTIDAATPEDVNDQDLILDAYTNDGKRLWDRIRVASTGWIEPNQVMADDRGHVFVVGGSSGELDGSTDYTESRGAFVMLVY